MATAATTGQPPRFSVKVLDEAGVPIIVIAGELDAATAGLDALIEHHPDRVTAINALRA